MSKSSPRLPEEELFIDEQDLQAPEQQKVSWVDRARDLAGGLFSRRRGAVMAGAIAAATVASPVLAQAKSTAKGGPFICKTVLECVDTLQLFTKINVDPSISDPKMGSIFNPPVDRSKIDAYLKANNCQKTGTDSEGNGQFSSGCETLAKELSDKIGYSMGYGGVYDSAVKAYYKAKKLKGTEKVLMLNLAALLLPQKEWVRELDLVDDTKQLLGKTGCFLYDGCTGYCGSINRSDSRGVRMMDRRSGNVSVSWDKLGSDGDIALVLGDPKKIAPNWGKNRKNCRRAGLPDSTKRILEMRKELSVLRNEIALSNPNAVYPYADVGYLGVDTPKQPFAHFVKLGIGGGVTWNRNLPTDIKFTAGAICSPADGTSDDSVKGLDHCAFYVEPSLGFRSRIASLDGGSELQLNLAPFRFIGTSAGGLGWLPSVGLEYWGGKNRSYVLNVNLAGGYFNTQQSFGEGKGVIQGSTIGATIGGNLWFLDGSSRI